MPNPYLQQPDQNRSTFTNALKSTYALEGSGVDKTNLPDGDYSKFGLRQSVYDSYTKKKKLPSKSVIDLSEDERESYVFDEFYQRPKIYTLPQEIIKPVFDYAFQSGPETAIMDLQKLVGTKSDGVIGPKTIEKVKAFIGTNGVDAFINRLADLRQERYDRNPANKKIAKGLKKRVDSMRTR